MTDIAALGNKQPVQSLWVKLIIGLQKSGLAPSDTPDDPQTVQQTIRDVLDADESRRILVLFDNADNFLEAEAESTPPFPVTGPLHRLMTETDHRFKVVFAGMHRVQRYQQEPNQPLAAHGQPVRVDVMRPASAQQLVRQPLETLGYRIKSSSVLRILAYTNYHPGLIQLFCTELIAAMHGKQINRLPPYEITQQDVEQVYLQQSVRQRISKRFGRTLALDSRYQAIAWSLIVAQTEPLQAYPPQSIEVFARLYWTEGFSAVSSDHFRALLNEMVGMGILVRNEAGQYRLHDPNLVRLMGSEQDIETDLLQLADGQTPPQTHRALAHVLLDNGQYSPLTRGQERLLMQPAYGRALIFTTRALGSDALPATLGHLLPINATPHLIPDEINTPAALQTYIDEHVANAAPGQHHLLYRALNGPLAQSLTETLDVILNADLAQTPASSLRVMLIVKPDAIFQYSNLNQEQRDRYETRFDAAVYSRRWERPAVSNRLQQHTGDSTDAAIDAIMTATSGWGLLLDRLFEQMGSNANPQAKANELQRQIIRPKVATSFLRFAGIPAKSVFPTLLRLMVEFAPFDAADFNAALINEFTGLEITENAAQVTLVYLQYIGVLHINEQNRLVVDPLITRLIKEVDDV